MALAYAHGAIQWLAADAVNTTYAVVCTDVQSGATFQPKALRFTWCGAQSATDILSTTADQQRGVGFAYDTSNRRCVGSFSDDANAAGSDCATMARNDAIVCTTNGTAADDGDLDLSSINTDGFTAIVDNQPTANLTVFWEAWGGTDITNVSLIDIDEPAATGNVNYTAAGFIPGAEDQVVMLAGVQDSNVLNTGLAEASGFMIGYATGPDREQMVITGNSDDASATTDTDMSTLNGECINMITRAGAATVEARAILTQFNAGGFRLNWTARGVTSRKYIAMAIKGGSWRVGSSQINYVTLNNTAKVSGLRFKPIGIDFISSFRAENASNASQAVDLISWGCASSISSRRSWTTRDNNAVTTSNIGTGLEYDQILMDMNTTPAIVGAYDVSEFDKDGFTIIVDDPNGSTLNVWVGWMAFGDTGDYLGAQRDRAKDQPMIRGPM